MRTPRFFLGIFAFALILLCLLLACGGSDEPADGLSSERATAEPTDLPDSERATNEPEGRTSSGQTTAAPPTASAEPSPTPKATAVPPLAQTSPETDRAALVALYNATGGPDWYNNNNWLSDVPISEWEGVTTDGNGRVTELELDGNQLSGGIPPELGKRGDTAGVGQPRQPGRAEPLEEPVERGDTAGVGQPRQPGISEPPRQPGRAEPLEEPVERGRYRRSWATSPTWKSCSSGGTS